MCGVYRWEKGKQVMSFKICRNRTCVGSHYDLMERYWDGDLERFRIEMDWSLWIVKTSIGEKSDGHCVEENRLAYHEQANETWINVVNDKPAFARISEGRWRNKKKVVMVMGLFSSREMAYKRLL